MYVSSIPGRLRIRTDDEAVLQRVAEAVRNLDGVFDVQLNPRTGSLLVQYDQSPETVDQVAMLRQELCPPPAIPDGKAASRKPNKAVYMTIAKRGMLSSLGLAMLFALLDKEDGHIISGAMFLGFLGYHLYGYRKRVLA